MKFKNKNGLYIPKHYMRCMGIEDTFPSPRSNVTAIRKGVKSPSGGGGPTSWGDGSEPSSGGTFSHVAGSPAWGYGTAGATSTTTDTSCVLQIVAGDTLVAWYSWEDGDSGVLTGKDTVGNNTFTWEAARTSSVGSWGCFGYVLSATAQADAKIIVTHGAISIPYRGLIVYQFRKSAGTVARDTANTGTGSSTSMLSGNITAIAGVAICGATNYSGTNFSAELIGDAAVDGHYELFDTNLVGAWYKLGVSGSIHGQATGANDAWVCNIINFKAT